MPLRAYLLLHLFKTLWYEFSYSAMQVDALCRQPMLCVVNQCLSLTFHLKLQVHESVHKSYRRDISDILKDYRSVASRSHQDCSHDMHQS